jgi:hypothetical protein
VPRHGDLDRRVDNPKLHTPDREKVWAACDEHKQPLADFLAVRSFLKRVEPLKAV